MDSSYGQGSSYVEPGYGWLFFAGSMMGIAGIMRVFDGIWALRYDGAVPDNLEGAILGTSLSTYGWIWIILGAILIVSSYMVLNKSQFARWIGIIGGGLLAVSAIWWMPFYPVWSLMYVFVGVLVVYGLAVYGGRDARP
jgi:hypothetical protein